MAALVQAVADNFQRDPTIPRRSLATPLGAVIAFRVQRSIALAMIGLLAFAAPCTARPTSDPRAADLVEVADTIVIGRVTAAVLPNGRPSEIDEWTEFDQILDITVDRTLASPAPLPTPRIRVKTHTYNPAREEFYAIFFLRRASDGSLSNAREDGWYLAAKQVSSSRNAPAETPLLAVEREMLEILATAPDRVLAPGTGVNLYSERTRQLYSAWNQQMIDIVYAEASAALRMGLDAEIRAGLRALAHGDRPTTRLWAAATLFKNEDADELETVIPDLMAPPPEAHGAAIRAGSRLSNLGFAAGSDLASFVTLLHSREAAVRSGAAAALRQGSREGHVDIAAVIDPLIDAVEAESDLGALRSETDALCDVLAIRTRPCPDLPPNAREADLLPLSKSWALAQRR
jgi:hypothetical protein